MKICVYCRRRTWWWQSRYSLHGYIDDPSSRRYWRHTRCAWKALENRA
jgi:hypothetical protein